MAKTGSNVMLFLLLMSMLTLALRIQPAGATEADSWSMFHHDLNHTGTSASTGPITNQTLWNFKSGGAVEYSSPAVVGGLVYVGSDDHNVYCLNATSGSLVWSYKTSGFVWSSPAVVDGVVYVGSTDYKIYAFGPSQAVTEFPSYLILPFFMMTTLLAAFVFLKRKRNART